VPLCTRGYFNPFSKAAAKGTSSNSVAPLKPYHQVLKYRTPTDIQAKIERPLLSKGGRCGKSVSRNGITLSVPQIGNKNLLIQGKATVAYELQEKAELAWLKGNKKREGLGLRSCQLASSHKEKKLVIRTENFMRLQHTWK